MIDLHKFKEALKDHLTFYHECLTPKHPFFVSPKNQNESDEFIVVSSPSRMGNHALISMLDGHPELPRVPGEDDFLRHSFFNCTYDLNTYLKHIRSDSNISYIRNLSSFPGDTDKWAKLKQAYTSQEMPSLHAGIQFPTNKLIVADFQDTLFDVNHEAYVSALNDLQDSIARVDNFSELFVLYLSAFVKLDPQFRASRFLATYSNSGMRRQCLWLCENFRKVRILASIRSFDSYAVSHIRSRYREVSFKSEFIQEAWEHWYHKVIDYCWIKANYPENIMLIRFEDISKNTQLVADNISRFLGIEYNSSMLSSTVFGVKNKGNSSKMRDDSLRGKFYSSAEAIPYDLIPKSVHEVSEALPFGMYI